MKTTIIKITLVFCLFAVFSCSKKPGAGSSGNTNPIPPSQTCLVTKSAYLDVVYTFQFDANYNLIAICQHDTLGNRVDSTSAVYTSGQLTGTRDWGKWTKFVVSSVTFSYTGSQLTQYYYQNVADASIDYYFNYTYNQSNQLNGAIKYRGINTSGISVNSYNFTYDATTNGNLNSLQVYDVNSQITDHSTLTYDSHTSIYGNLPLGARLWLGNGLPYVIEGTSLIIASNCFISNNNVVAVNDYGTKTSILNTGSYNYVYNSDGLPAAYTYTYTSQTGKKGSLAYTCH